MCKLRNISIALICNKLNGFVLCYKIPLHLTKKNKEKKISHSFIRLKDGFRTTFNCNGPVNS